MHCQMRWTPRGMHEYVWTCRHCGQQVTRNSADGHPHVPCTAPPRPPWGDRTTLRGEIEFLIEPIISGGAKQEDIDTVVDCLLSRME